MKEKYDLSDSKSILSYAKELEGKTFNMFIGEAEVEYNGGNKGALGQVIEKDYFGYDINSKKEADFKEAELELKVVPIKKIKKQKNAELLIKRLGFSAKERIVLSIINYYDLINETWDTTKLHEKLDQILMMFYLYEKNVDPLDLKILLSEIWKPLEEDIPYLKKDWEFIQAKVINGKAHELSEGDTFLLGACPKGSSKSSVRKQPNSDLEAMQRAFSLKRPYVDYIFNQLYTDNISDKKHLPLNVYDKIITEFRKIKYKSLDILGNTYDIAVNRNAKQFLYNFTSKLFERMMGITANEFNEKNISQIEIKTILLNKNNKLKESMSFEQINFDEIVESDWIESKFRSKFENKKMLWVVFKTDQAYKRQKELDLKNIYFLDIFYWNMPNEDLDGDVKSLWLDTIKKIREGDFDNFKKISETEVAHIRPKAKDSNDTVTLKSGIVVPKKSFWLNSKYVAKQIEIKLRELENKMY